MVSENISLKKRKIIIQQACPSKNDVRLQLTVPSKSIFGSPVTLMAAPTCVIGVVLGGAMVAYVVAVVSWGVNVAKD